MLSLTVLTTVTLATAPPRIHLTQNHGPFIPATAPIHLKHTLEAPGGTIVLMDHHGTALASPIALTPGATVQLLEVLPVVRGLDEAAYLQLINAAGTAVNTPLVIEPALSRRMPVVEAVETPERGIWTKVVGWQDEGAIDNEDLPEGAGRIDGASLAEAIPRDGAVVRSGWWVYPERDVRMRTDHGELWIDLREDVAPNTGRNFRALAGMGFYNDTICHRIINKGRNGKPFVIQGGDPTGTGEGGPGWWLPLEPSHLPHDYGVISMARADDPDSAGSQWFIALDRGETSRLDGQYCAFGEVVNGTDTIETMRHVELGDVEYLSSRPVTPPTVQMARIVPGPPRTPGTGRPDSRIVRPATTDER